MGQGLGETKAMEINESTSETERTSFTSSFCQDANPKKRFEKHRLTVENIIVKNFNEFSPERRQRNFRHHPWK